MLSTQQALNKLGICRATFLKHVKRLGIVPTTKGRKQLYPDSVVGDVEPLIQKQKPKSVAKTNGHIDANYEPNTGLTWGQFETKQDAIAAEIKNIELLRKQSEDWISANAFHQIMSGGIQRLEQVPSKAKSELGLSDDQTKGLQRMLDEVRQAWSEEIRK